MMRPADRPHDGGEGRRSPAKSPGLHRTRPIGRKCGSSASRWRASPPRPRPPTAVATTTTEVTNISRHGFWLLLDGRELFVPFDEFRWFKRAPVEAILQLE